MIYIHIYSPLGKTGNPRSLFSIIKLFYNRRSTWYVTSPFDAVGGARSKLATQPTHGGKKGVSYRVWGSLEAIPLVFRRESERLCKRVRLQGKILSAIRSRKTVSQPPPVLLLRKSVTTKANRLFATTDKVCGRYH